jgi:nicotinate-nucleotide adenylyltransferase
VPQASISRRLFNLHLRLRPSAVIFTEMSISGRTLISPPPANGRSAPVRLPRHAPGMRIGLFGGTFNPPHAGHRLVSTIALARLGLDAIWWLVTPGNPLKDNDGLPTLQERIAAARRLADHPRIVVTGVEAAIGTRYTYDTVSFLAARCHGVRFVWIMGADNLAGFHRWQHWRDIAELVPIAVIDRPGSTLKAVNGRAGAWLAPHRIDETDASLLPLARPPAFTFIHARRSDLSSTELRLSGAGLRV